MRWRARQVHTSTSTSSHTIQCDITSCTLCILQIHISIDRRPTQRRAFTCVVLLQCVAGVATDEGNDVPHSRDAHHRRNTAANMRRRLRTTLNATWRRLPQRSSGSDGGKRSTDIAPIWDYIAPFGVPAGRFVSVWLWQLWRHNHIMCRAVSVHAPIYLCTIYISRCDALEIGPVT